MQLLHAAEKILDVFIAIFDVLWGRAGGLVEILGGDGVYIAPHQMG